MTSPPLQSREQEAREMLYANGDFMRRDESNAIRAMIAFADAERERCARIAEADLRSDLAKDLAYEPEFHRAGKRIAAAIRNPLYQHGEPK